MSNNIPLSNTKSSYSPAVLKVLNPTVMLVLVILLGLALRFYDLGTESYWIDEMSTVIEGQQSIQQLFASERLDQPPGYYLPFHLWVQIFGSSEVSTRSFSALAGVGSIILIYLIGRELFGKAVGLLSAFLMAISEFQIYYSQQARFYSFFELTTLLSFLYFILALKSKRIIQFAIYGVSSILMVYSHTYGIFVLAAQNLFFILQVKKYRNLISTWLICQVLIILAFLPYFYPLISGEGSIQGAAALNSGGTPKPALWHPLRSAYRFIMPARRDRSWEIIFTTYFAAGVLFVAGTWIYAVRRRKSNFVAVTRDLFTSLQEISSVTGALLLVSCWFLIPILLPFILSLMIAPIYADRYAISAAPALYLLLALGIFSIRRVVPVINSLVALVIMIAPGLHYYYVTDVNEQWKEAAIYIEENSKPDEVIVFAPNMGIGIQQRTFDWYYQDTLQSCGLAEGLREPIAISEALLPCISGHTRFWVIIPNYPSDPFIPHYKLFFLSPDQKALHLIQERQFVLISVYLFELTK